MSQPILGKLGKYELRHELGKGAMGVVYRAWDPVLERDVALKVMASSIVSDDELRRRFEQEAKGVARLQHPNIVTIYDLGYDQNGSPFIAMELLKGTDLERRIRTNPPSFAERLRIVAQSCRGLSHAHRSGIVHRDVKPANIFVTEGGGIKIMDFGVARWVQSSQTQTGAVLGTADYMSPEQIRGQKVDKRSDIFSIGIILYRLLSDKKPFTGENIQATFYKILSADPPLLLLPDGTEVEELQGIVDRALAKETDDRYQTADEMADDIESFLKVFEGALSEDTMFDTSFDPGVAVDHPSRAGTGSGSASGRGLRTGSGRITRSTPGGTSRGGRTARGTSAPATAMGRTAAGATARGVAGRTAVGPATGVRPRPGPVRTSSTGLYVLLAVAVAAIGSGAYWYLTGQGVSTAVTTEPAGSSGQQVSPEALERQFAFAERLLENGQIAEAYQAVQNILTKSPGNERALELEDRIQTASAQQRMETPPKPAPRPTPTGSGTSTADKLAAEAAMAISGNELREAQSLIAQGRGEAPDDPRWSRLGRQLEARRSELQQKASEQRKQQVISGHLQQAARHIETGSYDQAIAAYDEVLSLDANNAAALSGRAQAAGLKQQLELARKRQEELEQQTAIAPSRVISESKTRYSGPGADDGPKGFETGDGIQVKKATGAPRFPAEVIIEINPPNAQPGQPFILRVRLNNTGNKPVHVKSLELVSSYGGRTIGKGQQLPVRTQRVNPRSTAVLHEVQSTWKEDQNKGSIVARVFLVGGGVLTKGINW